MYLLLVATIYTWPLMPSQDLDPSWRMAMGYYYENGLQFGRDVVFNYGPLGFLMGKTFSGLQFWPLVLGQLAMALISATVIIYQASRLRGVALAVFLAFFLLWGCAYEDALHMLVIAILGFELLRNAAGPWKHRTWFIVAILALYAEIKFTDLMLSTFVVLVACGYSFWKKRTREALLLGGAYAVAFIGGWMLLGQNPANLPAYFANSWQISQGWLWAMGFPAPLSPLWKGLVVLFTLIAYAGVHLWLNPDKPRAIANDLLLGAFVYMNWKHGFVRADGHMIGFFYCALLPMVAYPTLLDDPDRFRRSHRWIFIGAMFMSLWGLENALWGVVRQSMQLFQAKVWDNVEWAFQWEHTRQRYRDRLTVARIASDLYQTREIIGQAPVDVLGFEIGVAVFNKFNYRPRPVIQSYSVFNPELDRLNYDYYASDQAPEYALVKFQAIDNRLLTMDDAHVQVLLAHRYQFLRSEKGFQLWKRNPGSFDKASIEPTLLRSETVAINQTLEVADLAKQPLWLRIDLQPSFLGKLRSFFYKPPQVWLTIEDNTGLKREYLMPVPQGRTGFIVNPVIDDMVGYMHFASDTIQRRVNSIMLRLAPEDAKYFADSALVELSALKPATSAIKFFSSVNERLFHMFKSYPVAYEAAEPFSETIMEGKDVAIMHAPSQMIFDLPKGAKRISGAFGMMEGTYTNGGKSNGAQFIVYWSNGTNRIDLFQKILDPLNKPEDRGLHTFGASLEGIPAGGRLYLDVDPGPFKNYAWDWTGWTDIRIE